MPTTEYWTRFTFVLLMGSNNSQSDIHHANRKENDLNSTEPDSERQGFGKRPQMDQNQLGGNVE